VIRLHVVSQPAFEVPADLPVVPLCEDIQPVKGFIGQLDWWLNGRLSQLYKSRRFTGAVGQQVLAPCLHWLPFSKLVLLGMGQTGELSSARIVEVHRALASVLASLHVGSATVMGFCPDVRGFDAALYAFAMAEGLLQGIGECGQHLRLSKVSVPVEEERKGRIVDALTSLLERCKAEGGVRFHVA
jgi:hypothetical protein